MAAFECLAWGYVTVALLVMKDSRSVFQRFLRLAELKEINQEMCAVIILKYNTKYVLVHVTRQSHDRPILFSSF